MSAANATPGETLSFVGVVNIAVRLVTEKYPGAQLYEADTQAETPGEPSPLGQVRVVFRVKGGGTAIIKSTTWGEFGAIEYFKEPWVEDVVIPWPISMNVVEASNLLKQAGLTGTYGAITLRHPLFPGDYEPYYIFSLTAGGYGFVGVNDKKVTKK